MKKIIILVISVTLLACSTSDEPDPKPRLYLSPGSSTVSIGEQVNLDLKIENNQKSIFGISLQMNFESSSLSFVDSSGFVAGNMFDDQTAISFVQTNGDNIHLAISKLNGQVSTSGSGKIGTLTFSATSSANSDIVINQDELFFYDYHGTKITIPELAIGKATVQVQ